LRKKLPTLCTVSLFRLSYKAFIHDLCSFWLLQLYTLTFLITYFLSSKKDLCYLFHYIPALCFMKNWDQELGVRQEPSHVFCFSILLVFKKLPPFFWIQFSLLQYVHVITLPWKGHKFIFHSFKWMSPGVELMILGTLCCHWTMCFYLSFSSWLWH
jgi:hypothetical protein